MELDRTENELRDIMVEPLITQKDGYLEIPGGPGLGIEVNEEMLEQYLVKE